MRSNADDKPEIRKPKPEGSPKPEGRKHQAARGRISNMNRSVVGCETLLVKALRFSA